MNIKNHQGKGLECLNSKAEYRQAPIVRRKLSKVNFVSGGFLNQKEASDASSDKGGEIMKSTRIQDSALSI